MSNFKRIAAFALGLGGGIAAGYLSRPERRNKLRDQIVGFPSKDEEVEKAKAKKKAPSKIEQRKPRKQEPEHQEEMATA